MSARQTDETIPIRVLPPSQEWRCRKCRHLIGMIAGEVITIEQRVKNGGRAYTRTITVIGGRVEQVCGTCGTLNVPPLDEPGASC